MALMTELFSRLRGRQEKAITDAATAYEQLVAALADGKKTPPAEQVEAILNAVGKTPDELEAAVEQLQETRRLRPLVDELPARVAALKAAGAAVETHKKDVTRRAEEDRLRTRHLDEEFARARRKVDEAREAGLQLRQLDGNLASQYATAKGGEVTAAAKRTRLRDELRQLREAKIPALEKQIEVGRDALADVRSDKAALREIIEADESRLAALRQRAEALPGEIEIVEAEYSKQHARRRELQFV